MGSSLLISGLESLNPHIPINTVLFINFFIFANQMGENNALICLLIFTLLTIRENQLFHYLLDIFFFTCE